jgi:hypothetical protein
MAFWGICCQLGCRIDPSKEGNLFHTPIIANLEDMIFVIVPSHPFGTPQKSRSLSFFFVQYTPLFSHCLASCFLDTGQSTPQQDLLLPSFCRKSSPKSLKIHRFNSNPDGTSPRSYREMAIYSGVVSSQPAYIKLPQIGNLTLFEGNS